MPLGALYANKASKPPAVAIDPENPDDGHAWGGQGGESGWRAPSGVKQRV
jgi:hypothetical protein